MDIWNNVKLEKVYLVMCVCFLPLTSWWDPQLVGLINCERRETYIRVYFLVKLMVAIKSSQKWSTNLTASNSIFNKRWHLGWLLAQRFFAIFEIL